MRYNKNHPRYKHHTYVGSLETYFETGMECMGTIFHDDRGLYEGDHWDAQNHPGEKFMYHSLSWSIWFGARGCIYTARIFNKKGKVVYEGPLTKDKIKMGREKYRFSYLPKELSTRRWLTFCQKNYRMELYTNELATAIVDEYKIEYKPGDVVYDDLTGKDVVVMNVTIGKNKTIGYWVNSDHLEGGRHPQELTKIDWAARWKKQFEEEKEKNQERQDGD